LLCHTCPDGIEVHIDDAAGDGRFVEQGLAFKPFLPEPALDVILFVCVPGDELVQLAHEPAETRQALAQLSDTFRAACQSTDFFLGRGN